jgi:DNA-binding SARP family transcriptional activator
MMNLLLLDKLVQYCEIHQKYDVGLVYAWQILRHDHAYERAHRQLMRLYSMAGHRTQALYQYQRCVNALRDELGVEPSSRTRLLYEQIQADTFRLSTFRGEKPDPEKDEVASALQEMLQRLEQFSLTLKSMDTQVQKEITALESRLADHANRTSRKA